MTKPRDTTHIRIKISTKAALDKMLDGSSYDELIRKIMLKQDPPTPINPFKLPKRNPTNEDIELLKSWASVGALSWTSIWDSVRASIGATVEDSIKGSIGDSVFALIWAQAWTSVWHPVRASFGPLVVSVANTLVRGSVRAAVGAYIGSLFPDIKTWKYIDHKEGEYPFQPAVDLWKRGLVPSFDGKVWRLHSGKKADVVWKGTLPDEAKE